MRIVKEVINAGAVAASTNFTAYNMDHLHGFSAIVNLTGSSSLNGTLKLQVSNNAFLDNVNNNPDPNAVWADQPGSTYTVTADGVYAWDLTATDFGAVRVVYTRTAGSANMVIYIRAKGII